MQSKKLKIAGPLALVSAALFAVGAAALLSHAGDAQSGVLKAAQLSPIEEATIRDVRRGRPTEPADDTAITAHAKKTVAGETWKIVSYRAKSGKLCAGVTWPGEGQEIGCATRKEWFARGPVSVSVGARQATGQLATWDNFVLSGIVDGSRVKSIELLSTDCSTRVIPMDASGFFLDVTSSDLIVQKVWPFKVIAHGANGNVVDTIGVEPEAPDTAEARANGAEAPDPPAQCLG